MAAGSEFTSNLRTIWEREFSKTVIFHKDGAEHVDNKTKKLLSVSGKASTHSGCSWLRASTTSGFHTILVNHPLHQLVGVCGRPNGDGSQPWVHITRRKVFPCLQSLACLSLGHELSLAAGFWEDLCVECPPGSVADHRSGLQKVRATRLGTSLSQTGYRERWQRVDHRIICQLH
jgi:hypothetical protein